MTRPTWPGRRLAVAAVAVAVVAAGVAGLAVAVVAAGPAAGVLVVAVAWGEEISIVS